MPSYQRGFTLVEIAVVLVVIGLLLGGALKGQELIHSARVKSLATELRTLPTMIYTYQDRFRSLPGDDPKADTHLQNGTKASTPTGTLGNGTLNGAWNSSTQTDESYLFWQHVRLAGLSSGSSTPGSADYLPRNAEGGPMGITGGASSPIKTLAGTFIACSQGISGRYAKQIDTMMDDGDSKTGSIQVMENSSGTTSTVAEPVENPLDQSSYTVCYAF